MAKTMNLKNKLYQKFVIDKIIKTDWELGNSGPLVIELDPTAVCDLACPHCYRQYISTPDKIMNYELALKLIDQAADEISNFVEKCKYYIEHDEERMKIVNQAYKYFLEKHTWEHKIDQLINEL